MEYQDDDVTLSFSWEYSAPPRPGQFIVLDNLPKDLQISRSELARRIRRKQEKWRFKVIFVDATGHEIEPTPPISVVFRDLSILECRDGDGVVRTFPMRLVVRPKYGIVVTIDDVELAYRIRERLEHRRHRVDFVDSAGTEIAPRPHR